MGRVTIIIILLGLVIYLYFTPPETVKVSTPVVTETKPKIIMEETIKEEYR